MAEKPGSATQELSRRRRAAHEDFAHQILSEIEAGRPLSQRSLASSLGIALGLTNLLLRRLVRKGWVRASRVRSNRVAYFLTPTGIAEKARMSRDYLRNSMQFYASARNRVRTTFEQLSRNWLVSDGRATEKRILFVGADELAEVGYVCLQETDLTLVGVVDFNGRQRFFNVPVYSADALSEELLRAVNCDRVVVLSLTETSEIRNCLERLEVPPENVSWV